MISGDEFGVLNRLLLNESLRPSPEGMLRTLGWVHVYTASSLHLFALEAFLHRFAFRHLKTRRILTVLFWFYLFLIWKLQNFRLGFARVLFLFLIRSLARERGIRWRVFYPLFLAFCFDFSLGIDAGWMHYYLAVLGGLLGLEFARNRSGILQHGSLSVASWLMTAPLDLYEHHLVSWMTPFWSLVTIPPIALFLYPASVLSFSFSGNVPDVLMGLWNGSISKLLHLVDLGFTFSYIEASVLGGSALLAFFATVFWFKVRSRSSRIFLLVPLLILLLIFRLNPKTPETRLAQINVGQGDSLWVRKNARDEMVDVGSSQKLKSESQVLRFTRLGIGKLDCVLLTHLDEDHAGGLRVLLPWIPVASLETSHLFSRSQQIQRWLHFGQGRTRWSEQGCFQNGKVEWIAGQKRKKSAGRKFAGNTLMGMVTVPLTDSTVYLATGDADAGQEWEFWKRHRDEWGFYTRKILKISHHGSRHSSSEAFLSQVSPHEAVISVGRRNRYHHPHPSVIERLHEAGIRIHRTDRMGDYVWVQD